MATGRIGVTPTLGVRWSKAPAGGTTSLSGLDDNSVSLVYSVGYEQVYRNGVLLSRTNDYTATTGNSITLIDATIAGDIIEVFANELVPLTDAISKGQFTAKGALLSATAASNDQVLTADSSTATGLKWATPSSGGMTLLSTTTLSGTTTISSISGSYTHLYCEIYGVNLSADGDIYCNANSSATHTQGYVYANTAGVATGSSTTNLKLTAGNQTKGSNANNSWALTYFNYASTAHYKAFSLFGGNQGGGTNSPESNLSGGFFTSNSAITSLQISSSATINGGTIKIYGVN
jgi:hypothetical protein